MNTIEWKIEPDNLFGKQGISSEDINEIVDKINEIIEALNNN